MPTKTSSSDAKKEAKQVQKAQTAIKGKEFGSNKGGFFSGLGFTKPTKQEKPKKKEKDDELLTHATTKKQKSSEDRSPTFKAKEASNATVIKKASNYGKASNFGKKKTGFGGYNKQRNSGNKPGWKQAKRKPIGQGLSFTKAKIRKPKPTATPAATVKKTATTSQTLTKKTEIILEDFVTVKEFSEKMGVALNQVIKVMLQNQIMGGINTKIDFDTAALLADEFGVKVQSKQQEVEIEKILTGDLQAILETDKQADNLQERPPVVTVMGHVDHGKTSLLDYLRKTNITGGEAGGITQGIGASSITHNNKKITFIDTPGHQLFTALRARGAKLTNIAVIVIAADDGIKPQTVESINHAKEAGVPIIVAVTKIDKPNNFFEKIKSDIGNYGLIPEEWGGDVSVLGVSSKTGEGIDNLLDQILLQAEMLELKYNPDRKAVGVIVDAQKDARQGINTSLIVLTGTLKVGDVIVVHNTYGKVKRMLDFRGKPVKKAVGGDPVMILGLSGIPAPGRVIEGVKNEKEAKIRVEEIQAQLETETKQSTMQHFLQKMKSEDTAVLKLILKADGPSSLEALQHAVDGIQLPKSVSIKKIHTDIGDPTDSDLSLGQAADAVVIGFNTKTPSSIKKKADVMKVSIKNFEIIYELVDYIEQLVNGLIEVEMKEVVTGKLDVLAIFFKKEKMMVIGGKVTEGKIYNGSFFRVIRGEEVIGTGTVKSLQKEQDSVKEVSEGYECGMKIHSKTKIMEGDTLEYYIMEEEKQI